MLQKNTRKREKSSSFCITRNFVRGLGKYTNDSHCEKSHFAGRRSNLVYDYVSDRHGHFTPSR